jgi:hypothetical protein
MDDVVTVLDFDEEVSASNNLSGVRMNGVITIDTGLLLNLTSDRLVNCADGFIDWLSATNTTKILKEEQS